MNRRDFLAGVGVALTVFAGCNGDSGNNTTTEPTTNPKTTTPTGTPTQTNTPTPDYLLGKSGPPSREDLESARRPPVEDPPESTEDTVSPREYPSTPSSFGADAVEQFVESHERAYRCNALLEQFGADLVSFEPDWDWTVALDSDGDAGVGRCSYRYSDRVDQGDGSEAIGDSPTFVVTYYVDDSLIVRAEDTGRVKSRNELSPDPWETGVILEPIN